MARALKADDILPLVETLTPQERVRLLRLIARPASGEFSADDEPLAWDSEGGRTSVEMRRDSLVDVSRFEA
jgi:hypothetical protein